MFHPLCHFYFFFFNDTATTEIYTLSLHDALPISPGSAWPDPNRPVSSSSNRKPRSRSEEHTSELQSRRDLVCRLLLEKKKYSDLSCEGRSEINRRDICYTEWDHHWLIYWPLHSDWCGQIYLTRRCFFFYCCGDHRDLHSFPTRRSSDLAHRALVQAQPLHHFDGVVVALPDRDVAFAQPLGDRSGRLPFNVEGKRRDPPVHAVDAVQRAAVRQAVEEPLAQLALMCLDRFPADRVDVLDRCDEAREQLVRERPRLEPMPEWLVGGGANLVRAPSFEQLRRSVREPQVRSVELVRLRRSDVPFRVRAEHQLSTVSVHLHGRAWTYSRHRTGTRQVHGTAVNFSPSNLNSAGRPFSL